MSLPALAVRRPVAIVMLHLAVLLIGAVSLFRMPVSLLPEVAVPRLVVWTAVPDTGPTEIETTVTEPIEGALSTLPGVTSLESVSSDGQSVVSVEFPWGTDMGFARLHVRERLDQIAGGLPRAAARPAILRVDPGAEPILIAGATAARTTGRGPARPNAARLTTREIERLAATVFRRRLEQLDGVGRVAVVGGTDREIRVQVDPLRLEAHGLTIGDVAEALSQANASAPGGTIRRGHHRYALRIEGGLASVEEIGRVPVLRGEGGATVRVADLAAVADTVAERDQAAWLDGRPAIGLVVFKEGGANTVAAARRVERVFHELERRHPGIDVATVTSQAGFITGAIADVVRAIVLGGLLAGLVLLPFLGDPRWPAVLALAIPISAVGAFVLLHASGASLNVVSLGGLALGIGMLVDASIVVLENVFRHQELGLAPETAAVRGAEEVQGAIAASTLTTIAVFGPIVLVEGPAGALFGELALAVTFSLLASLAVAVTLLPALAARLRKKPAWEEPAAWGGARPIVDRGFAWIASSWGRLLALGLDRPRRVVVGTGAVLAAAGVVALLLPRGLLPEVDQRTFTARLALGPGTPLERTEAVALELDRWLRRQPGVEAVQTRTGRASTTEAAGTGEGGLDHAVLDVRLGSGGESTRAVTDRLRRAFDELPPEALRIEAGRATELGAVLGTTGTELGVEILGPDREAIQTVAGEVAARLAGLPRLAGVGSGIETGHPEVRISLDRDAVARHGLDAQALAGALSDAVRGRVATHVADFDRQVPVLVLAGGSRQGPLDRILSGTVDGVPIRPLLKVETGTGPTSIRRHGQQRIVRITADVRGGDLARAIAAVREVVGRIQPPEGVEMRLAGGGVELGRSLKGLGLALLLALLLIYMILAAQFESLILPAVVLLAVPLSLVGAVFLLAVTGSGLETMSLIGIVVLAGIAVNNAILLVDSIRRAEASGSTTRAAIEEAGRARFRPIVMTTSTTILGLFPMAFGAGSGAELRGPLAIAVIGGMTSSTVLVPVVVPVCYRWIAGRRR